MKKRLLTFIMILATVFGIFAIANTNANDADAAGQPAKLYLTPNSNWNVDNARFAAYFFGNGETWVGMTKVEGETNLYEVTVPTSKTYPSVIFCRMNPSASANNWNNKWNQTADLSVPTNGNNHYTVKEGTWDKGGGTWSVYSKEEIQPWQELTSLVGTYFNEGTYIRDTEINIDMNDEEVKQDLFYAFHAQCFETVRRTYFYNDELWMTNANGVNSGYGTNANGEMYHFSYDANGAKVVDYTVAGSKGVEAWYTTLKDIEITENQKWEVKDGVYTSSDSKLIEQFLAFTAPCFLNFDETTKNIFTLSHVSIQEDKTNKQLVMKLYVKDDTTGFIKDGSNVLSTAKISYSDSAYSIAGSFNEWNVYANALHVTNLNGVVTLEVELQAGTYEFKVVLNGGTWHGNSTTINDSTSTALTFSNSVDANCKLVATGGTYVFKLTVATKKLEVIKK